MSVPRVVKVRKREETDRSEAARALVATHSRDGYPVEGVADPIAWLSPPGLVAAWVAEVAQRVVGHVAVSHADREGAVGHWVRQSGESPHEIAVLSRLFVAPEARGQSVGQALVNEAVAFARQRHVRLVLDVLTKDVAAIGLYEHLGWCRIGITQHRNGWGAVFDALCFVSPEAGDQPRNER